MIKYTKKRKLIECSCTTLSNHFWKKKMCTNAEILSVLFSQRLWYAWILFGSLPVVTSRSAHSHMPSPPWSIPNTRVGWKVHRLTLMQWLNLTKCGLFLNIVSPAVHTLLPSVLQCLDSCGIEALILILEKLLNCRYDLIIGPILLPSQVFFMLGYRK